MTEQLLHETLFWISISILFIYQVELLLLLCIDRLHYLRNQRLPRRLSCRCFCTLDRAQLLDEEGRDLAGVLVFAEVGHRPDTDWCGPVRPPRPVRGGTRHQPPARGGASRSGKEVCKRPSGSGGGPLERLQGQVVAFQSTAGRATIILNSRRGTRRITHYTVSCRAAGRTSLLSSFEVPHYVQRP